MLDKERKSRVKGTQKKKKETPSSAWHVMCVSELPQLSINPLVNFSLRDRSGSENQANKWNIIMQNNDNDKKFDRTHLLIFFWIDASFDPYCLLSRSN